MKPALYRNYLLTFLAALYAFNLMDFTAFGMALQSIKLSLQLSDTELGLASGVAFSIFYSSFGVAIGRWADRGNRVTILALTRVLWGALVILTGRARSLLQLLIARMGVAVGEAGCLPPAYSLLAEYFQREERPRAMGVFFLGAPVGSLLGFVAAGWMIQLYGWREMFAFMGILGFGPALVVWLTLREPRHGQAGTRGHAGAGVIGRPAGPETAYVTATATPPPLGEVFRRLFRNATYRNLLLALMVSYFFSSGYQWQATFFTRSYGLESGTLGTWLALVYGVPGIIGSSLGGAIASRFGAQNERMQLVAVAVLYCINSCVLPFVYLTSDYRVAFALIALSTLAFALGNGPVFGTLQAAVPSRMRAISIMVVFFFANLIGMGLGPLMVGAVSDGLRPMFGTDSLRYALCSMSPWFLWCAWHSWRASTSVERDVEAAKEPVEDAYDRNAMSLKEADRGS